MEIEGRNHYQETVAMSTATADHTIVKQDQELVAMSVATAAHAIVK